MENRPKCHDCRQYRETARRSIVPSLYPGGVPQMPIYMKYDDIKSDQSKAGYVGWFELNSLQLSQHRFGGGSTGNSRERPTRPIQDVVATKDQDSKSPLLFQDSVNPRAVEVLFDLVGGDPPQRYLRVTLTNCMISGYSLSRSEGDSHAKIVEMFTFVFDKIEYQQTVHD
jgi:type VI protein secretion system component Hcp